MVWSLLEFSCPVWDPYRQGDVDKLNKIQRAAARFVTNNYQRKSSVTAVIQHLGWTDLQTKRKNFRLTSLYNILNGLIAVLVSDLLNPADERTRGGHKHSFKHIRANTTLGENPLLCKTIPDWNHLPLAAIESRSIAAFKRLTTRHVFVRSIQRLHDWEIVLNKDLDCFNQVVGQQDLVCRYKLCTCVVRGQGDHV